jgi:NAD(P) transhydrogenase subunit beta
MLSGPLAVAVSPQVQSLAYLVSAILFVFALKGMASPKTARQGNLLGAIGMLLAIVITLVGSGVLSWTWIIVGLVVGSAVGAYLALTVQMTAMPQFVAIFNGFGGLASALVVIASWWGAGETELASDRFIISVALSTLIGWVTFTGSLIAFAKLQGLMTSSPIQFPLQKVANFAVLAMSVVLIILQVIYPEYQAILIPLALLSAAIGVLFVIPIGGADMPVVISLLNSYSGLAAAMTGFVLQNSGLIIAGALVGASGIILTRLMCVAMNRSLANVLFGGVGAVVAGPSGEKKNVKRYTAEDAAMVLTDARMVIIVPGYGMAVAQAQHAIKEMANILEQNGVEVKYGIHPVAGRMPGHMNVLLAEAEVPYAQLFDLEEINGEFEQADAAFILGANDVVNPTARTAKDSPIYGMPILDVDKARSVMIVKRSLSPGFAGVDNPLFYEDKTMMLFGDAKSMVTQVIAALKS